MDGILGPWSSTPQECSTVLKYLGLPLWQIFLIQRLTCSFVLALSCWDIKLSGVSQCRILVPVQDRNS